MLCLWNRCAAQQMKQQVLRECAGWCRFPLFLYGAGISECWCGGGLLDMVPVESLGTDEATYNTCSGKVFGVVPVAAILLYVVSAFTRLAPIYRYEPLLFLVQIMLLYSCIAVCCGITTNATAVLSVHVLPPVRRLVLL